MWFHYFTDLYVSGMDRKVQRVHKDRLDRAIAAVSSTAVNRISAFAWDPLFICKEGGDMSLVEEILANPGQPIISECRLHSQTNRSIVLIGYNLAYGLGAKYEVSRNIGVVLSLICDVKAKMMLSR